MDLVAKFVSPEVDVFTVTFGSLAVEGLAGPDDSPYAAQFVMPRFLWEQAGRPLVVFVRVSDSEPSEDALVSHANAWLHPVYEGG